MTIRRNRTLGGDYEVLLGIYPHGTQPDLNSGGVPAFHISTIREQNIQQDFQGPHHALWDSPTGATPASAVLTVDDNDFSDGAAIILGDHVLESWRDFTPGAAAANTATDIAASISRIHGYAAQAVGDDVQITYQPSGDLVEFRVRHYGSVVNFTGLTPSTGFMNPGEPTVSDPVLT